MATVIASQDASRAFGGRYRLLEFVGEGSNARVYVAEDLALRRRVALKILRADAAERAGFAERFADEMRATAALSHPRVLPVYDWGLEPQPYAVTEYLTGGSLAAVLREGYRLTPSQALMVGLEAARALVNVHRDGRAHLGLTPASILFDSSSRPYISDLGLAVALGGEKPASATHDSGNAPAVARDSSPQWRNGAEGADRADPGGGALSHSRIEQAQDVHDLALVLCEAVTGAQELTVDVGGSDPIPITALGPLQAVLERAIAADPIGRLTASELASELLRVASLLPRPDPLPLAGGKAPTSDEAPTPADSTEAFEQVGPTVSERSAIPHDDVLRRRWPGLALAVLLVAGGSAGGVWLWLGESDPTVPELAGHTGVAAVSAAADAGWAVNEILVRAAGTERGEIVGTEPAAGATLADGATLDVFVSLGEPLVPLADLDGLFGMTVNDATAELGAAGLGAAGTKRVHDEVVPSGNVVGLDVAEGVYELEPGRQVKLLVSDGPADRTVPAVPESLEPGDASDALHDAGLAPRVVLEFSADVAEGSVIGFRPASGAAVPIDSTVRVLVSLGPTPPPEPEPPAEEAEDLEPESEDSDS